MSPRWLTWDLNPGPSDWFLLLGHGEKPMNPHVWPKQIHPGFEVSSPLPPRLSREAALRPHIRFHRTQSWPCGGRVSGPQPPRAPDPAPPQGVEGALAPFPSEPLSASFCRSPVPNCPPGSDPSRHGCTPSGMLRQRVSGPRLLATGRPSQPYLI